jgi:enoyl-CoA hydratase/carnithine racemase
MDYEDILYSVDDGHVATITLNRPRYRNAQSRRLREEMDDAFDRAAEDTDVRVVVLCGAGDAFSAGHDIGTPDHVADLAERPYEQGVRGMYKRTWDLNVDNTLRWRNHPKPTIAAVQGYCIFGGWIIASGMDLIFAADDAKFLPGLFQYFSVPWDLGVRKTKEILFEGRFLTADEAFELGLVNRVVSRERLMAEVMEYAHRVAENDPFQLRMIKLAVNQAQDAQGFTTAIRGAFQNYLLTSLAERDPAAVHVETGGRRRLPGVQKAFERLSGAPPAAE